MGCFYAFVSWVGWIDVSLGIWGWIGYAITVSVLISKEQRNADRIGDTIFGAVPQYDPVLLVEKPGSRVSNHSQCDREDADI